MNMLDYALSCFVFVRSSNNSWYSTISSRMCVYLVLAWLFSSYLPNLSSTKFTFQTDHLHPSIQEEYQISNFHPGKGAKAWTWTTINGSDRCFSVSSFAGGHYGKLWSEWREIPEIAPRNVTQLVQITFMIFIWHRAKSGTGREWTRRMWCGYTRRAGRSDEII